MTIGANIERVRRRVSKAAAKVGRDPGSVTIVAVTKTVPPARIREALAAGIEVLGENRIQEAREKIREMGRPAAWHLIGHLQTNKAREAAALFDAVHSVDGLKAARALNREAGRLERRLPILLQVNISGEASKFGLSEKGLEELVRAVWEMPYLALRGLMTIPPWSEDPEASRPIYRRLRELRDRVISWRLPGVEMQDLSMGMSHDFETAVEEGATLVRVGTAIFGERL